MAKAKRPKVDPLAHACERCGVGPGVPCTNYRGQGKASCRERGRPDLATARRLKKAAELTAKTEASYGPLFASLMPESERTDLEQVRWRERRAAAVRAEWNHTMTDPANRLIEWVRIYAIRNATRELLGADADAKIYARITGRGCGNSESYIVDEYRRALCTAEVIPLEYGREVIKGEPTKWNATGERIRVFNVSEIGPAGRPCMAGQEFDRRFNVDHLHGAKDAPEPPESERVFQDAMSRLAEGCTRG